MTTPSTAPARKHFSMIRGFHLADAFTLGNAACGVGAVFLAMAFMASHSLAQFLWAAALAPRRQQAATPRRPLSRTARDAAPRRRRRGSASATPSEASSGSSAGVPVHDVTQATYETVSFR